MYILKLSKCMRNRRRKIYDDGDFKEVVKNFYTLISDINKSKLSLILISYK